MNRLLVPLLLLAIVHSTTSTLAADDGPSKDVPELQALANYVGSWDVVITSKGSPFLKGQVTAKWILDGRFIQQIGSFRTPDGSTGLKFTRLMTYDQKKKAYRIWAFFSNGIAREEEGKWDAKTRTLTSVNRSNGNTITTTSDFARDGIVKLEAVTTDRTGKEIARISATNTRRKK